MGRETRPAKKPPIPDVAGRPPPNDPETERTVLATVILIPTALFKVSGSLKVEHFFSEQHQLIYEAALAVLHRHKPVDPVTVKAELRATGKLERAGGAVYLGEITTGATAGDHIEAYADKLVELWTRRDYQRMCSEGRALSWDAPDVRTFLAERQRELSRLALPKGRGPERIDQSIQHSISEAQQRRAGKAVQRYTPTGYRSIDRVTGGICNEDLWVIAGRPGSGKTSLALSIARNIATPPPEQLPIHIPEFGVVFFELEMPRKQIASRLICMDAGVSFTKWRDGQMSEEEWTEAQVRAGHLRGLNFWIDDASKLRMSDMEARVRAIQSEWDRPATFEPCPVCHITPLEHHPMIDRWFCPRCWPDPTRADAYVFDGRVQITRERRVAITVIDNLSLANKEGEEHSREREVAEMTGFAKDMAKEDRLNIGVILLVHLSRDVSKRKGKDKRPQMEDLRESGSVEQNADTIIFPWRPGYYQPGNQKIQHEAQFIIPKQRNGPQAELDVHYEPECSRFDDPHDGLPVGL